MAAALELESLLCRVEDGLCVVTLNRPDRKNAVHAVMYEEITKVLKVAGQDPNVVVLILTGAGDYYSSGNDLGNFKKAAGSREALEQLFDESAEMMIRFVDAFIEFPKPLIAAVNGPALGIMATTLGLCDTVYASTSATFSTPFSQLALSPEGCSTVTFPAMMGSATANDVLLFGRVLSAEEAKQNHLVARVFPAETFLQDVLTLGRKYAKMAPESTSLSKKIIRSMTIDQLKDANRAEAKLLRQRWSSREAMEAVITFFMSRGGGGLAKL